MNKVQLTELEHLIDAAVGEGARVTSERLPDGTVNVLVRYGAGAVSVEFQREHLAAYELADIASMMSVMVRRFG